MKLEHSDLIPHDGILSEPDMLIYIRLSSETHCGYDDLQLDAKIRVNTDTYLEFSTTIPYTDPIEEHLIQFFKEIKCLTKISGKECEQITITVFRPTKASKKRFHDAIINEYGYYPSKSIPSLPVIDFFDDGKCLLIKFQHQIYKKNNNKFELITEIKDLPEYTWNNDFVNYSRSYRGFYSGYELNKAEVVLALDN